MSDTLLPEQKARIKIDELLKMLASGDYNHYESGENRQN